LVLLRAGIWEAEQCSLEGNQAAVSTVAGTIDISATVVFTSTTTAQITVYSCEPISLPCPFQAGTVLAAEKIF